MPVPVVPRTWVVGPLRVSGPHPIARGEPKGRSGAKWSVMAVDSMTEEVIEKSFITATNAQAFIDSLVTGADPVDPLADDPSGPERTNHMAQQPMQITGTKSVPTLNHRHLRPALEGAPEVRPFNLKAVRDALTDAGLDPWVDIARVLQEREPVFDKTGARVIGEDGIPATRERIAGIARANILIEMGQYISPKLKAVEVKLEDKRTLTAEQLDKRIADILARVPKVDE